MKAAQIVITEFAGKVPIAEFPGGETFFAIPIVLGLQAGDKGHLVFIAEGEKVGGALGRLTEWVRGHMPFHAPSVRAEAYAVAQAAEMEAATERAGERVLVVSGPGNGLPHYEDDPGGVAYLLPGRYAIRRLPDPPKKVVFWRRPGPHSYPLVCGKCGEVMAEGISCCGWCGAEGVARDLPEEALR